MIRGLEPDIFTFVSKEARHCLAPREALEVIIDMPSWRPTPTTQSVVQTVTVERQPEGGSLMTERTKIYCPLISAVKVVGYPSTRHYDYQDLFKELPEQRGLGFVCGDGCGGMTAECLHQWKQAHVIYNSRRDHALGNRSGEAISLPTALYHGSTEWQHRVVGVRLLDECPTDLTDIRTMKAIQSLINQTRDQLSFVMCDAEGLSYNEWIQLVKNLGWLSRSCGPLSLIVLKCYLDILLLGDPSVLGLFAATFGSVTVLRSGFVSFGSQEVYLISTNNLDSNKCIDWDWIRHQLARNEDIDLEFNRLKTLIRRPLWQRGRKQAAVKKALNQLSHVAHPLTLRLRYRDDLCQPWTGDKLMEVILHLSYAYQLTDSGGHQVHQASKSRWSALAAIQLGIRFFLAFCRRDRGYLKTLCRSAWQPISLVPAVGVPDD